MTLVQIFLPLYDEDENSFPGSWYEQIINDFTEKFGGVTLYKRAPANGFWKEDSGQIIKDKIVVVEVMASGLEHDYWKRKKTDFQLQFKQEKILIRANAVIVF